MPPGAKWAGDMVIIGDFPETEGRMIRFWSVKEGWGRLDKATRFLMVPESMPAGARSMELVPAATPFRGHWGFFSNRSDLMRIADFERLPEDAYGNPLVFTTGFECPNCGHSWFAQSALPPQRTCPQCEGHQKLIHEVTWSGPESEALRALWERLPMSRD